MDEETARYIINYFSHLLSLAEKAAIKHTTSEIKMGDRLFDNSKLTEIYKEKGWITADQTVLDLLKDGYDAFELNVANRILTQHKDQVHLNNCPKCNKLARTPLARQCRHCGYDWHQQSDNSTTLI